MKNTLTIPRRVPTKGPEFELLNQAIKSGIPFPSKTKEKPILFQEPRLPTGFPDLVAVFAKETRVQLNPGRLNLDVCHLKLLYHLHRFGASSVQMLVNALLWKTDDLKKCIQTLHDSDLVHIKGESISPKSLREVFAISKIVALEAKISHWQKALEQAISNTWFASHSYVLLPKTRALPRISEEARKFGVGVLIYDGKSTQQLVRPNEIKIPSSYGSWLINEWVIRKWFMES